MPAGHLGFLQRHEQTEAEDLFPEIALVQFGLEDRFVEVLELRKSEARWQQLEADRFIADFAFQASQGSGEDVRMIESQLWHFGNREPFGFGGIGGRFGAMIGKLDEREMSDTNDPFARIAMNRSEGKKLFEKDIGQAGLFSQLASGGFIDGFLHATEPTGKRPAAFERLQTALNEENLEFAFVETEDDAING